MRIALPDPSLVVLVGAAACGKSTFARRHFGPFEVLSSDVCRALVSNDANDQSATTDAFAVLHHIAGRRLERGLLTVVDATNVRAHARASLLAIARRNDLPAVAIVLDLPDELCHERNRAREHRTVPARALDEQLAEQRASISGLEAEGFARVFVLTDPEQVDEAVIVRAPLPADLRALRGPFDVVGDVHGCFDELVALLRALGWTIHTDDANAPRAAPPAGRTAVFVGDLVDRGPDTPAVLRLVMSMVAAGHALCVAGNHDAKLAKALRGRNVQIKNGLETSLAQLAREPAEFRNRVADFLARRVSHCVLDDGRLVVAHAGMRERYQGRESARVRAFGLYGETTGETDELGLPVRLDWAAQYRGHALVVYGHTPIAQPEWVNRTINIDTGCVFGGRLTALRYPERELVSVPAAAAYATSARFAGRA